MNQAASRIERYSARVYHVAAFSLLDAGAKQSTRRTSGSPKWMRPLTDLPGRVPPIVGTLLDRRVRSSKPRWGMSPQERLLCME